MVFPNTCVSSLTKCMHSIYLEIIRYIWLSFSFNSHSKCMLRRGLLGHYKAQPSQVGTKTKLKSSGFEQH